MSSHYYCTLFSSFNSKTSLSNCFVRRRNVSSSLTSSFCPFFDEERRLFYDDVFFFDDFFSFFFDDGTGERLREDLLIKEAPNMSREALLTALVPAAAEWID